MARLDTDGLSALSTAVKQWVGANFLKSNKVVQSAGNSETLVMSQAATTELTQPITDEEIDAICADDDGDPVPLEAVLFVKQDLTEAQKEQARENLGAVSESEMHSYIEEAFLGGAW